MAAEADRIAAEAYKMTSEEGKKVNEAKVAHLEMTLEKQELKIKDLERKLGRGGETFTLLRNAENYFALHGSNPNRVVAAHSHLCEDLLNHCIAKAKNVRGHLRIPYDFLKFNGYDGQASRSFSGLPFVITFGSKTD